MSVGKRYKENSLKVKIDTEYDLKDAITLLKSFAPTKFDESIDVSFKLNLKKKKEEVSLRTTVNLPNGNGKKIKVPENAMKKSFIFFLL